MIEKCNLTVFLDPEKVKDIDLSLYPGGIPCQTYLALGDAESPPANWIFLVDEDELDVTQNYQLYNKYGESRLLNTDKKEFEDLFIPFDDVAKVIDWEGIERDLDYIKECWLMSRNAKNIKSIHFTFNGETLHILIMCLQQSLFLSPAEEINLNQFLLPMAVDLIDEITADDRTLKEAYLKGFPCEYITQARELLFP